MPMRSNSIYFFFRTFRVSHSTSRSFAANRRDGKGAQHSEHFTFVGEGRKCALDFRIFGMALEIDKENVLALLRAGREGFDPGEIDLVLLKQIKRINERARVVAH